MTNTYIMSAVRSPIGTFGGSLKNFNPVDLGTLVSKEAISRSNLNSEEINSRAYLMSFPKIQNHIPMEKSHNLWAIIYGHFWHI